MDNLLPQFPLTLLDLVTAIEPIVSVPLIVMGRRAELAYALTLLAFAGAYARLLEFPEITVLVHLVVATYWAHRSTHHYD